MKLFLPLFLYLALAWACARADAWEGVVTKVVEGDVIEVTLISIIHPVR
jgi:hypothetical protein